jgi:hypothetical protein
VDGCPYLKEFAMPVRDSNRSKFFPRTEKMSNDTPQFWAENKDKFLRQQLIRDIEKITKRPLLVFFHSPNTRAEIEYSDARSLDELLYGVDGGEFDLLIETPGGHLSAVHSIIDLLINSEKRFRAIVPDRAMSGGCIMCLAANSILMGPTSQLGPIDAQIDEGPAWLYEQDHIKKDAPVAHAIATAAMDYVWRIAIMARNYGTKADTSPLNVREHKRKLLKTAGGQIGADSEPVDPVIEALVHRIPENGNHAFPLDMRLAKALGLKVEPFKRDDALWQKLYFLHAAYLADCDLRGISKIYETKSISRAILDPDRRRSNTSLDSGSDVRA